MSKKAAFYRPVNRGIEARPQMRGAAINNIISKMPANQQNMKIRAGST